MCGEKGRGLKFIGLKKSSSASAVVEKIQLAIGGSCIRRDRAGKDKSKSYFK